MSDKRPDASSGSSLRLPPPEADPSEPAKALHEPPVR